jgi:hypothetical protein
MKEYRIVNGTSYDPRTPSNVIRVLEKARLIRTRLHISLGETDGPNAGRDWLEEFESHGYVGRSMGPVKVPLLLANRRSMGGGAILDHQIVRIRLSASGHVVYQHSAYHFGHMTVRPKTEAVPLPDGRVLTVDIIRDGELHASFENTEKARRWVRKLGVVAPITA